MSNFDEDIITELQDSMEVLKTYFNKLAIDHCKLRFVQGKRTLYKENLINFLFKNSLAQQKEIISELQKKNYDGKPIGSEQVSRLLNKLIEDKIIIEIDHLNDDLKQNKQAKKSYSLNPISLNLIDSINTISKDLEELIPLRLSGFTELIKFLIERNYIHGFNERYRKLIDIKTIPGDLVAKIQFFFICKESNCIPESCKMICFQAIKDVFFKLSNQKEYRRDLIDFESKKNNCIITIKIPKSGDK